MSNLLSYPDIEYKLNWIPPGNVIANDTETTGLDVYGGHIPFLFSFANTEGEVGIVPKTEENMPMLREFYHDKTIKKIYHNRKFDYKMCRNVGLIARGPWDDTLAMFRLIDENLPRKTLAYLSKRFLDFEGVEDDQVNKFRIKYRKDHGKDCTYDEIPDEILHPYAGADAFNTIMLWQIAKEQVKPFNKFFVFDMNCHAQSMKMEDRGALIDKKAIRPTLARLRKGYRNLSKALKKQTGMVIDPDDKKALVYALFKFGEVCKAKTDKGDISLKGDILKKHYGHVPWVKLFLKMKKLHKNIRDIDKMKDKLDENDRIHPSFNQSIAVTGRSSSSGDINGQNVGKIPYLRKLFIPPPDHYLVYFDYSQIEYRLFAHESGDKDLIEGYIIGGKENDMHTKTFKNIESVESRDKAKIVNFLIIYGGGPKALAEKLNISFEDACEILNTFKENCPAFDELYEKLIDELSKNGHIEDIYGKHWHVQDEDAWKIINTKIQGTAANVLKEAKLKCEKFLKNARVKSQMIMEIHDELIFELHKDEMYLIPLLKQLMEDVREGFSVPFEVDVEYTDTNWNEKKPFTDTMLKEWDAIW